MASGTGEQILPPTVFDANRRALRAEARVEVLEEIVGREADPTRVGDEGEGLLRRMRVAEQTIGRVPNPLLNDAGTGVAGMSFELKAGLSGVVTALDALRTSVDAERVARETQAQVDKIEREKKAAADLALVQQRRAPVERLVWGQVDRAVTFLLGALFLYLAHRLKWVGP